MFGTTQSMFVIVDAIVVESEVGEIRGTNGNIQNNAARTVARTPERQTSRTKKLKGLS